MVAQGVSELEVVDFDGEDGLHWNMILNCLEREDIKLIKEDPSQDEPTKADALAAVYSTLMPGEPITVENAERDLHRITSYNVCYTKLLRHMLGLTFIGANRILAPAFYARGDTRTPAWSGIVAVGVNVAAAFALQPVMGGAGIALALSIASAVNTGALIVMMVRMGVDGLGAALGAVALYVLKLLAYSAVAAAPVLLLRQPLAEARNNFV